MSEASCVLPVRVIANASRDQIVGWHAGALKIKTATPPESGQANRAVCVLLAQELGLSKRAVSVLSGATSQLKCLKIAGMDPAALLTRIPRA
jgi:uncharacterized protein (TIGR00251 family)